MEENVLETNPKMMSINRIFVAPVTQVWQAFTESTDLALWWGPRGVTISECTFEPKVGGKFEIVMLAGPELGPMQGSRWPMSGVIEELQPPQKLVYRAQAVQDDAGNFQIENVTTILLTPETENQTTLQLTMTVTILKPGSAVDQALAGMEMGWQQSLDKLAEFLSR